MEGYPFSIFGAWGVPVPDQLILTTKEHPEPFTVPLRQWFPG